MKDKKFVGRFTFWFSVAAFVVSIYSVFQTQVLHAELDATKEVASRVYGTVDMLARRSFTPSPSTGGDSSTPNQ